MNDIVLNLLQHPDILDLINEKNCQGDFPLMIVCNNGMENVAFELLQNPNIDLYQKNTQNKTILVQLARIIYQNLH